MCVCVKSRILWINMLLELFISLILVQNQVLGDTSSKADSHGHWGYNDQNSWSNAFEDCGGKSQSPIDIETSKSVYDPSLPAIKLDGYDLTGQPGLTLQNNGHTLQLSLPNTMRIVEGFNQIYLAAQLHFHWGTVETPGSEHTIDNVHFPAEIHVVHYNAKYPNISVAASKPDGLAVLGGLIGIGLHENENYGRVLPVLKNVSVQGTNVQISGLNIRHLLPNNLQNFYRYTGSLTTPPCYQSVNWTIFNDTIRISRRQLAALEDTLKAGQNQILTKNFRAPQRLHGRRVLASFQGMPFSEDITKIKSTKTSDHLSKGDILAIVFGVFFAVTLLAFFMYASQQRKQFKEDSRQNVVYKPTPGKEDV